MQDLKKYTSKINQFLKDRIIFKDINTIYKEPKVWKQIMAPLEKLILRCKPDYIAGVESIGFIVASALSFKNEIGFITTRKPNKLPVYVIGID